MLSGDVHQRKRQRLLGEFQAGKLPVLIATDVAARGLHIPGVTHVVNFDLPQNAEDYVHRIGRTARAGESGHAVSFACEDTAFSVPDIEEYIGHKIPTAPVKGELLAELQPPTKERLERIEPRQRDRHGGKGSKPSAEAGDGGRKRRRRRRKPKQAVAGQSS